MLVKIIRFPNPLSTPGVLLLDGIPLFTTLELPWKDNQQSISCIPEGEYVCKPHISKRFGHVFKIMSVPNRFDILFHVGNSLRDTHGCILVGKSFRLNDRGESEVANSKLAIDEMRVLLGQTNSFMLNIIN